MRRLFPLLEIVKEMPDCIEGMTTAEAGAKYHAFIAKACELVEAKLFVELGTYIGETSKYVAKVSPETQVITIDVNPNAKVQIESEPIFTNIRAYTDDAIHYASQFNEGKVDVLFIDVNHDFSTTKAAFESWEPLVRHDGLIFIDDINLDSETTKFNEWLKENDYELIELPEMHATGLGLVVKK